MQPSPIAPDREEENVRRMQPLIPWPPPPSRAALIIRPEDYPPLGPRLEGLFRDSGVWERLGPSATKSAFQANKEAGRRWVEAVCCHDFDAVIVGHASAPVAGGGKAALRSAFDFIY